MGRDLRGSGSQKQRLLGTRALNERLRKRGRMWILQHLREKPERDRMVRTPHFIGGEGRNETGREITGSREVKVEPESSRAPKRQKRDSKSQLLRIQKPGSKDLKTGAREGGREDLSLKGNRSGQ